MSSFEDLFRSKPKDKQKTKMKEETPVSTLRPQPSSHARTPRTSQISEEKVTSVITKDDLQSLKNDLLDSLKQAMPQQPQIPEELLKLQFHVFNRENLLLFIGRRGKRGTKLCELRDFFYGSASASEIDKEVQKLRREGLIRKNRNGWMSLINKAKFR